MLEIKDVSPELVTEFYRRDPTLCYLGLPDEALANLMVDESYILYKDCPSYLWGVYINDNLICVIKYELFTSQTINLHIALCSYMHDSGAFQKVQQALKKHIIETTSYIKVIVMCPKTCTHIQKAAEAYGFVKEGQIPNCIVWRTELTDIIIYGLSVDRDSEEVCHQQSQQQVQ